MFTQRLRKLRTDALKSFEGIQLDPHFFDKFNKSFDDAGLAAGELQKQLRALEGEIPKSSLDAAKRKVDDWAQSQRDSAIATNLSVEAQQREVEQSKKTAEAMTAIAEQNKRAAAKDVEVSRERVKTLQSSIREGKRTTEANKKLTESLEDLWAANEKVGTNEAHVREELEKTDHVVDKHSLHWRNLSANTRQWTLIIGAVLAGMQDIAVLGSAAGGGLIALGGAGSGLLGGLGGVVALLVTLNKDIENLPANVRPAAREFKNLTDEFTNLRNIISIGALGQMPHTFDQLTITLRTLSPEFEALGVAVGHVFTDLATNTKPGTKAFAEISRAVQLAGPNFENLAGSAGTFGVAFLRAFNRAQPLVEDLEKWIRRLATEFDAFTRSSGFDEWMRNTRSVFEHLGPLVDALGRSLNDLVTARSVARTNEFIDNLTGFMPNLTRFLDTLGTLDVFGLLAQGLNDFGRALEPLAGPAVALAEALNRIISVGIDQFAKQIGTLAGVLAPITQGFANFLGAIPEDVIRGAANGLLVLAGAMIALKAAKGVTDLLGGISGTMGKLAKDAPKTAAGLTKIANGAVGLAGTAVGVIALASALQALNESFRGLEDTSRNAVANNTSLKQSYGELGKSAFGFVPALTDIQGALDNLKNVGTGPANLFGTIGATFSDAGRQASALASTLDHLDEPLAALAQSNLPAATQQFGAWATEVGATDEQVAAMIDKMPAFKEQLEAVALTSGKTATAQDLVQIALHGATTSTAENTLALQEMEGQSKGAGEAVDGLAEKIRGFGSATLDTREAQRSFESAIDDLTQSVTENGRTLDIHSEKGRANEAALDDLAKSTLDVAAATYDQTHNQDLATAAIATGRAELIKQLGQFGITGKAAEDYADKLGLTPKFVKTAVELLGVPAAENTLTNLARTRTASILVETTGSQNRTHLIAKAAGGTLYGPQHILAGEAGPEAIVPLRRPLGAVDPSVRWLSAIAQGKSAPAMASGGIVGGGKQITVSEGAILVQGVSDPEEASNAVVRRLFERIGG